MTYHPKHVLVAGALAAACLAAGAQDDGSADEASIDALKSAYLRCDRLMSSQRVDRGTAQQCSLIGERLKQRGFDGSFERLIEWWQAERRGAETRARFQQQQRGNAGAA